MDPVLVNVVTRLTDDKTGIGSEQEGAMTDHLELRPGGKLIKVFWHYDEEAEEGSFQEEDVTEVAPLYLFTITRLHEDVRLCDVIELVEEHSDFFQIYMNNWIEEFVEESKKPLPDDFEEKQVEYLELYWHLTVNKEWQRNEETGRTAITGHHFPSFHGIGKEDALQRYCVSFSPANELAPLPLRLKDEFLIIDEEGEHKAFMDATKARKDPSAPLDIDATAYSHSWPATTFTLGEIVYGIFWELSWWGSPARRDEKKSEMEGQVERIKSGEEEMYTLEEVEAMIEEKRREREEG